MQGARMLVSCGLARHAFATISTKHSATRIDFSSKTLQGCVCLNRTVALFPISRVALTSIQKSKLTRRGNAVSIFRMVMVPIFFPQNRIANGINQQINTIVCADLFINETGRLKTFRRPVR
ncbi:MAG: hypothetical protein KBG52_04950 [Neisseria sp.]|nr:hypothetical protein [Neisseria sp.]